jgi:hypothetical protein
MAHKAKSIAMQPSPAALRASPAAPRAFDRDAGRWRIAKGTHRVALGEAADDRLDPEGRRPHSKSEPGTVVLRRDGEQAQKAAAHRFLRAEAAALRDPLARQA